MGLPEPIHKCPDASFTATMPGNTDERGTQPRPRKGETEDRGREWGELLRLSAKGKEGRAGFLGYLEQSVSQVPQPREEV